MNNAAQFKSKAYLRKVRRDVALYDARLLLSKDMAICALPIAGAVLAVESSPNRLT